MADTAGLRPADSASSLRAEAPSFTAGQTKELRPSNLRHLRTNPHPGRGLDAALDFIPFTPSQGIITPSPIAASHYDQQVLMYPFTPQGPAPSGAFEDGLPGLHSISEEGSGNSGGSYTTTFSPFRWPMPVSPTAFPVQEAFIVSNQGASHSSGMTAVPGMVPVASHEYLYQMQIPPGSPVYLRSPTAFTAGHSWSSARRPPSRLSGMQGPGAMYLTMPTPGSPVYPAGMNHMDFSQALNMGMVYPFNAGSPVSSPRWQPSANLAFASQGPPTPPRNSRFGIGKTPFRAFVPAMPPHAEHSRGKEVPEVASERTSPLGLGGSFLQSSFHADSQVPMNARQRRTARRKAEREAKARAEEEARQATAGAARGDDLGAPTEHSDEESSMTVTLQRTEPSLTAERE